MHLPCHVDQGQPMSCLRSLGSSRQGWDVSSKMIHLGFISMEWNMKGRKLATEFLLGFTLWQWLCKKVLLKENHKEKAKSMHTHAAQAFHHPPERTRLSPAHPPDNSTVKYRKNNKT